MRYRIRRGPGRLDILRERLRATFDDPPLIGVALVLSLFGVAMIYSAGLVNVPRLGLETAWLRQLVWLGLAMVAFGVVGNISPRWMEWAALPAYVASVALLALTLLVGTPGGAGDGVGRWLELGPLRFQPAELAKLACILALARLLAGREEPPGSLRDLLAPGALVGLPLLLVVLQPDLGTALAFVGILFAALFWAGTPLTLLGLMATPGLALVLAFDTRIWSAYMVLLVGFLVAIRSRLYLAEAASVVLANLAGGTIALPLWNSLAEYQKNRILVFLDPSIDPQGAGWNLLQSRVAIGSGGLTGQGFTQGTQKRLDFLPEQHTDFIVSVIGEELGFVGISALLLGFGYFLHRLLRVAERTGDPFAGLVVLGIFGAWLVHIVVNIGMTVGVLPITGIPLPFISYGGTFLLMSWAALGAALGLSRNSG